MIVLKGISLDLTIFVTKMKQKVIVYCFETLTFESFDIFLMGYPLIESLCLYFHAVFLECLEDSLGLIVVSLRDKGH